MPPTLTQSIPSVDAYIAAHPAPGTGVKPYSYVDTSGAVKNIAASSPDAAIDNAPNRDIHSGVINPPLATEPSVISTDNGRSVLKSAVDQHNLDMQGLTPAPTDTTTKTNTTTDWAMKQVGGVTADEAKATNLDLTNYTYDTATGYFLPNDGTPGQQATYKADQDKINDVFSSQLSGMDAATTSLLASIGAIYSDRIAQQQDVNRRELQGFNTMNIRSGTARYAGGVAQSILTADENAGLDRIRAIAHEESNLMATANDNLNAKKYTAFMDNRQALDKLRAERNTTLKDLQTKALAAQKSMNDQKIQASRDSAIAGLVEQGITDPAKMLDYLNHDQQGNPTGDFTAKDVTDSLKLLSPTDDLKGLSSGLQDFFTLKQRGMLPDSIASLPPGQQALAFMKLQKLLTTLSKGSSSGSGVYTPPVSSEVTAAMHLLNNTAQDENGYAVKGPDGYVDPNVYRQIYDNWLQAGYDPKTFFNYFPAARYINPADNASLPSYLRTAAKDTETASNPTGLKPTAAVIGAARALKDKGASDKDIQTYISESGYDSENPAFNGIFSRSKATNSEEAKPIPTPTENDF